MSVFDPEFIKYLNTNNNDFGYTDWINGVEKDITKPFIEALSTSYSAIKLDGNKLYCNNYWPKFKDDNPSVDEGEDSSLYYKEGTELVDTPESFIPVDFTGTYGSECELKGSWYSNSRLIFTDSSITTTVVYYHDSCEEENKLFQEVIVINYTQIGKVQSYNIIEQQTSS